MKRNTPIHHNELGVEPYKDIQPPPTRRLPSFAPILFVVAIISLVIAVYLNGNKSDEATEISAASITLEPTSTLAPTLVTTAEISSTQEATADVLPPQILDNTRTDLVSEMASTAESTAELTAESTAALDWPTPGVLPPQFPATAVQSQIIYLTAPPAIASAPEIISREPIRLRNLSEIQPTQPPQVIRVYVTVLMSAPTPQLTATATPTNTPSVTNTVTATATETPTFTPSSTPTETPTHTSDNAHRNPYGDQYRNSYGNRARTD